MKTIFAKAQSSWNQISSPWKILAVAGAVLSLATALWIRTQQVSALCEAFPGRQFSAAEFQRFQLAWGRAGLNQFKFVEQQVLVPRGSLPTYLKALVEHDAIPADLIDQPLVTPSVNPFLTREQQREVTQFQKKQQLADLLRKLPFVKQVWVELDQSTQQNGWERATIKSCVVSVLPALQTALTEEQIQSIRQIAVGAVAGLAPDHVVISDLTTGMALAANDITQDAALTAQQHQRYRENQILETAVRSVLSDFPDAQISIREISEPPSGSTNGATSTPMLSNAPALMGTNSRARLTATSTDVSSTKTLKIVEISVPPARIPEHLKSDEFAQEDWQRAWKNRVEEKLASIAPGPWETRWQWTSSAPATHESSPTSFWLHCGELWRQSPGGWMAAGSGLLLISGLLLTMRRRRGAPASVASAPIEGDDLQAEQNLRANIHQLVEKNPELVARVLQDWIRDAG